MNPTISRLYLPNDYRANFFIFLQNLPEKKKCIKIPSDLTKETLMKYSMFIMFTLFPALCNGMQRVDIALQQALPALIAIVDDNTKDTPVPSSPHSNSSNKLPVSNESFGSDHSTSSLLAQKTDTTTRPSIQDDSIEEDDDLVIVAPRMAHPLPTGPVDRAAEKLVQRIRDGSFKPEETKSSSKVMSTLDLCVRQKDLASVKKIVETSRQQGIVIYHTPLLEQVRRLFFDARIKETQTQKILLENETKKFTTEINKEFAVFVDLFRASAAKYIMFIQSKTKKAGEIAQIADDRIEHINGTLETIAQLYPRGHTEQVSLAIQAEQSEAESLSSFTKNPLYESLNFQSISQIAEIRKIIQKLEEIPPLTVTMQE